MTWHPGEIYKAWEKIHHGLYEAMKQLPHETLQFLAFRATDSIIRQRLRRCSTGWTTGTCFQIGAGSCLPAWSVFDVQPDDALDSTDEAAEIARANGQLVAWDASGRSYAIALFDHDSKRLQPLTDEQAAILINRDPLIAGHGASGMRRAGTTAACLCSTLSVPVASSPQRPTSPTKTTRSRDSRERGCLRDV